MPKEDLPWDEVLESITGTLSYFEEIDIPPLSSRYDDYVEAIKVMKPTKGNQKKLEKALAPFIKISPDAYIYDDSLRRSSLGERGLKTFTSEGQ